MGTAQALTVLVVESDADTRSALVEVLGEEGYRPVAIGSGDQAIEYLSNQEPPCLVLLDLGPSCESELGFLRWLREQENLSHVRVAIMTAWRPAVRDAARYREHIAEVLQKPFDIGAALKVVEEHCGQVTRSAGAPN